MADNITLNPGSGGSVVATDEEVGVGHHEYVKVEWGPDNTFNKVDDTTGKRIPIKLGEIAATLLGPAGGLKVEDAVLSISTVLQASQVAAAATGTTTRTITTGLGNYIDASIVINVTSGGSGVGTLRLYLEDSFDGGTTWNDLAAYAFTFGAAGTTGLFLISGRQPTSQAFGSAQATETMVAPMIRVGPWGDRIRVREKVAFTSGTPPTYTISGVFKR